MDREHPLILRARVAEQVAARFVGKRLAWGEYDCAQLALAVFAGLALPAPIAAPRYGTERRAIQVIRRAGFDSLEGVMDATGFRGIAPAMALPADILGFRTVHKGFGMAIGVMLSGGRCMAFKDKPDIGQVAILASSPADAYRAWRLPVGMAV